MKSLKILFVLCIMLGFSLTAKSQGKSEPVEKPMKGTFNAIVVAAGPIEELSINGNATHIGKFTGTMYFNHSNMSFGPTGKILNVAVYGTIVAANGDEIEFGPDDPGMTLTGPGVGTMSGLITLKPGTGRFADCSGVITTTGHFDMNNDYAIWSAEGWIKY